MAQRGASSLNPETSADAPNHSCLLCRQRKVKCDRRSPCSNCRKAEQLCTFVPPVRGKRGRSNNSKKTLREKLARYEALLDSHGVAFRPASPGSEESLPGEATQPNDSSSPGLSRVIPSAARNQGDQKTTGKLVHLNGYSRYYESPLWSNLGNGLQHPEAGDQTDRLSSEPIAEDGEAFFESEEAPVKVLTSIHLPCSTLPRLSDLYLERVDSLAKVLHFPSFWQAVVPALQHPATLSKSLEALIFSFYLSVISTLSDQECRDLLNMSRADASRLYRGAARQALMNARFLSTSNITTLQAWSLFLICVRNVYSAEALHILSGIALRLARKMGLHRDGAALSLSPFDTEMRRRLWWHLAHIDFRIADVLGIRPSLDLCDGDAKIPSNVSDAHLDPGMAVPPEEEKGITPVTMCLIRCEIMKVLTQFSSSATDALSWEALNNPALPVATRDEIIDHIEDRLEKKYLRYCDPANDLHTCVSIVIRSSICKMRLFAHNPKHTAIQATRAPDVERDIVFSNAMKLLGYAPLMRGAVPGLEKYKWQMGTSYIWNTVLYVLIEVRRRKTGPEVERAWPLLGQIFKYYPKVPAKTTGATVYAAISSWTIEAWNEYCTATKDHGTDPATPDFIRALQEQSMQNSAARGAKLDGGQRYDTGGREQLRLESDPTSQPVEMGLLHDFPDLLSFETNPAEWLQWEQLVSGYGECG